MIKCKISSVPRAICYHLQLGLSEQSPIWPLTCDRPYSSSCSTLAASPPTKYPCGLLCLLAQSLAPGTQLVNISPLHEDLNIFRCTSISRQTLLCPLLQVVCRSLFYESFTKCLVATANLHIGKSGKPDTFVCRFQKSVNAEERRVKTSD